MRIVDTYDDMRLFAAKTGGVFQMELWEKYAAKVSPSFPEKLQKDASGYDFQADILPVITCAVNDPAGLARAYDALLQSLDGLQARVQKHLGSSIDADIVFYLGLCNGAGWATELDGRRAVLLGAEKLLELGWQDKEAVSSLLYHELGHIWHGETGKPRPADLSPGAQALWQLFQEGVAMRCEELLGGDAFAYRQDRGGWLAFCQSNDERLFGEYLRRMDKGESTAVFFGDWNRFEGYADVGYYLGHGFVKSLAARSSLLEIINMDFSVVESLFRQFAG